MDLRGFSRRIRTVAADISSNADKLTRKVALAVDQTVVMATPVDTGRARSNWIVSLGAPVSYTVPAYTPGKGQSTAQQNAQQAIDQGKAVIAGYNGGTSINITNNLVYIGALNNGWSAQAPANFVEQAIMAGVQVIPQSQVTVTKT